MDLTALILTCGYENLYSSKKFFSYNLFKVTLLTVTLESISPCTEISATGCVLWGSKYRSWLPAVIIK
jgi:hypothetical protein